MQRLFVINEHKHTIVRNDLSDVFLATFSITGDLAPWSRSCSLLESWSDGILYLRTDGLCLRLGEGERCRRGDGDLRCRGDWLLRRCADARCRGDDDIPRPPLCFTSDSPWTRGDLDFDLCGDFLLLSPDAERAVWARADLDLSCRPRDLDPDFSFFCGDRDLDLYHSST